MRDAVCERDAEQKKKIHDRLKMESSIKVKIER